MKKALVTGGAGFIGSHLVDALLSRDWEVWSVDNFITGHPRNITHLGDNPNFKFIKGDVTKPLAGEILKEKFTAILHFASPASPRGYYEYPLETSLTNSLGTYQLLELARENKARFILASTSEVYGDPQVHPQPETYWGNVNPVGPRSCYDESKRFAESLTMIYLRKFNLDTRIIRIFNTYGPRMDINDGRVMPNFITGAIESKPLVIYGDGKATRSFCFVDDLVSGVLQILEKDDIRGEIFNLGATAEITILELTKLIAGLVGKKLEIKYEPPREDDPTRRRPDITRAKKILGWQPAVSLEDGLRKTIEYFRALHESRHNNSHL